MNDKVKYVDKDMLAALNNLAIKAGFNRALPLEVVADMPADKFLVVSPLLIHDHKAGVATDPHMRCSIYAGPDINAQYGMLLLDIDMNIYNLIPVLDVEREPVDSTADDNNTTVATL